MVNNLDYEGIKFPFCIKDYRRIEQKNIICINVFCYANGFTYPVYVSLKLYGFIYDNRRK